MKCEICHNTDFNNNSISFVEWLASTGSSDLEINIQCNKCFKVYSLGCGHGDFVDMMDKVSLLKNSDTRKLK